MRSGCCDVRVTRRTWSENPWRRPTSRIASWGPDVVVNRGRGERPDSRSERVLESPEASESGGVEIRITEGMGSLKGESRRNGE